MREQGVQMWSKEDWINLLSLRCAFIPNGSDRSRGLYSLPSLSAGRGHTHGVKRQNKQHVRMYNSTEEYRWWPQQPVHNYQKHSTWWHSISRLWVIWKKLITFQIVGEIAGCLHFSFWRVCSAITKKKISYLFCICISLYCETHGFIHPEVITACGKHDLRITSMSNSVSVVSKSLCKFTGVTPHQNHGDQTVVSMDERHVGGSHLPAQRQESRTDRVWWALTTWTVGGKMHPDISIVLVS